MNALVFQHLPWLWALAPLAAVPLVIHLLNRRFPQVYVFSSIRLIKQTMAQRSRLFRYRNLILLLLRTLLLCLLIIVFLGPLLQRFGSHQERSAERASLIVFDHSLSMEYRIGGLSARRRAVAEAEKIIAELRPQHLLNIILAGHRPRLCFPQLSPLHSEALTFLDKLEPGLTEAVFNKAIAVAVEQLASVPDAAVDIYFISDFQRQNWTDIGFEPLPERARVFFVDVGSPIAGNRAVVGAAVTTANVFVGDDVAIEVTLANYGDQAVSAPLEMLVDDRDIIRDDAVVRPWSIGRQTVQVTLNEAGLHRLRFSLPADGLEQDDAFSLVVRVAEQEEVVILTDGQALAADRLLFLQAAINPYGERAGSLQPRVVDAATFTRIDLAGVRKLFVSGAPRLGEAACQTLIAFLRGGGGIVYLLDGPQDAANVAALDSTAGGDALPLRLAGRQNATQIVSGAQQILRGDFDSRFLQVFRGERRRNLAFLEFFEYYQAVPTGNGKVLLTYADETPAMALSHIGLGTLLLCNFSISELSSNIARQRLFPAWIQDLIKRLDIDPQAHPTFVVGEEVSCEVWQDELRGRNFLGPDGKPVLIRPELMGDRIGVRFAAAQPGFYLLGVPPVQAFAANCSPRESDLRQIDTETLISRPSGASRAHVVAGRRDYRELQAGAPMFHWLVFACLLLVVAESIFQTLLRRHRPAPPLRRHRPAPPLRRHRPAPLP